MCETANQQFISSHMVVYKACKMRCRWLTFRRCFVNRALFRNRSLRDAKPARHLFVWFAKHCLAEHCLSFRGDADECEKQFCFVFCICLAFFDSRLWRPLLYGEWKHYCSLLFTVQWSLTRLCYRETHSTSLASQPFITNGIVWNSAYPCFCNSILSITFCLNQKYFSCFYLLKLYIV